MNGKFEIIEEKVDLVTPNKIKVISSKLKTPGGKETIWGIFDSRDAVVVLALDKENNVYLKREWRLNRKDYCWEVVSGWVEDDHPTDLQVEEAATRELQEEVGQKAGKLTKLLTIYPTNHFRGKWHLFLAEQLSSSQLARDEHEYLDVLKFPFLEAYDKVAKQQIPTAQNVIIFQLAKELLKI